MLMMQGTRGGPRGQELRSRSRTARYSHPARKRCRAVRDDGEQHGAEKSQESDGLPFRDARSRSEYHIACAVDRAQHGLWPSPVTVAYCVTIRSGLRTRRPCDSPLSDIAVASSGAMNGAASTTGASAVVTSKRPTITLMTPTKQARAAAFIVEEMRGGLTSHLRYASGL